MGEDYEMFTIRNKRLVYICKDSQTGQTGNKGTDIVVYEDLIFFHVNKCYYQVIMIIINGLQDNITSPIGYRLLHLSL